MQSNEKILLDLMKTGGEKCVSSMPMKFLSGALLLALTAAAARENGSLAPATRVASHEATENEAGLKSNVSRPGREDVLSIQNGRFYLEGKPFAEISFNKYDLFWQLYDQLADGKYLDATNPLLRAQDKALRDLHELGFETIR